MIYHFIKSKCLLVPGRMFACLLNASSNHIYLGFRKEIDRFVKEETVSRGTMVSMMEIAVHGDMDVSTITKWSPKRIATKACGAALHEQWRARLWEADR